MELTRVSLDSLFCFVSKPALRQSHSFTNAIDPFSIKNCLLSLSAPCIIPVFPSLRPSRDRRGRDIKFLSRFPYRAPIKIVYLEQMATETPVHFERDTHGGFVLVKNANAAAESVVESVVDDGAQISAARYFKLASELRTLNYTRAGSRKVSPKRASRRC